MGPWPWVIISKALPSNLNFLNCLWKSSPNGRIDRTVSHDAVKCFTLPGYGAQLWFSLTLSQQRRLIRILREETPIVPFK